jgi:tetratricopeptide (TPR) repeat protein
MALVVLLPLVAGCGSPSLWSRWQAERDQWQAQRMMGRLRIEPRLTSPDDLVRAAREWRRVADRWPAEQWIARAAHDSIARDVARIGARAAIQAARLDGVRGDTAAAAAALIATGRVCADVWPIPLEAALARVTVLERSGDSTAARAVDEEIARSQGMLSPDRSEMVRAVLDAGLRVAAWHRHGGRDASADSARRALASAIEVALADPPPGAAAGRLWMALGDLRMDASDPAERGTARDAYRIALGASSLGSARADAVIRLAEGALAQGQRDTAVAYARWAEWDFERRRTPEAFALEARAWEELSHADSALGAWGRFVDLGWHDGREITRARWERARLFESLDRWEQARGELHAVVASDPLSETAFRAMRRLVDHHVERNEPELAVLAARWGVERIGRTLATVRDPGVLLVARRTKADLLLATDDPVGACAALVDLWRNHSGTEEGVRAGFQAAALAESGLKDPEQAVRLYRELERHVTDPARKQEAQAALARLSPRS